MSLASTTLRQLVDVVRVFVRAQLVPAENDVSKLDDIPEEIVQAMRQMGLFGLSIPESHGGLGLLLAEEVQIVIELSWASPCFRSLVGTNNGIGSQGIVIDGTEEQKQTYLHRIASGELIASFALTEPDAGSDAGSITTRAIRDGDDFLITGTKRYITNAPRAGLFTVFVRTDPESKSARGVSAFLIEADAPGLTLGAPDVKMGQRGTKTCDVRFDEVRVPSSSILGGIDKLNLGFATAMKVLDRGHIHIAAACVGAAERLIEEALSYAVTRRQFGQPIAEFQLVQAMLADSRAEAYAARCMVEATAAKRDAGHDVTLEAACCKMFASEMVGRVADRAVQIHGGAGYMADYPVERFYRDVRLFRIYEGTTQIQQLVVARNMLAQANHGRSNAGQ